MRWRFRSIPELSDLPAEEQQSWWDAAGRDRSTRGEFLSILLFLAVIGGTGAILLTITAESVPTWLRSPLWAVIFVIGARILDLLIVSHYRKVVRRLRRFESGRDESE